MGKLILLCLLILVTSAARSQSTSEADAEFSPYPDARITLAQWQDYRLRIDRKYQEFRVAYPEAGIENFNVPMMGIIAFTLPSHPAHPAIVTQQIEKAGTALGSRDIGYFAGDEREFQKLWLEYEELARKRREWIRSGQE